MYLKNDKGSNYKKNWFLKVIKYREIVLKMEFLGSCYYFDVYIENIYYIRLCLIKRCELFILSVLLCR